MSAGPDPHDAHGTPNGAAIEHRHLRSAIEYAVLIAEETQRRKPPMPVPNELRAFFGKPRIPSGALGRLRRAVEADDLFRRRIAAGASPELVDDVGLLWLRRPDGWAADAEALIAAAETERASADLAATLRREEKRRAAAEEAAIRARADAIRLEALVDEQRAEVDRLVADLEKADDSLAEMRAELLDVRNEARHARDREASAVARLDEALARATTGRVGGPGTEVAPPVSEPQPSLTADQFERLRQELEAEVAALRDAARRSASAASAAGDRVEMLLADHARRLQPARRASPGSAPARRPLRLPGGVLAASAEAATFLVRSDAAWFVDGYNVSMLGWPNLPIDQQRSALVAAVENLAHRFGTDITVVFDGAEVVGAHAGTRRASRVVYSPPGVIADDVIRSEVTRLPVDRAVVVATNDAEVARDVRAMGANLVPSNALLAVL